MQSDRFLRCLLGSGLLTVGLALSACAVAPPEQEPDTAEPVDENGDAVVSGTVADAVNTSCTTASVKPLSQQIIDEMTCMSPGTLAKVPERPNLSLGDAVFPYLVPPARDALLKTLDAHPSTKMTVNSMFRTVAQQYLLSKWGAAGRCGIGIAAHPGNSNHETGLAIDVDETVTWRSSLQGHAFDWYGSADPVHYDFEGTNQRGLDVKAFQRLWNRNHPEDPIAVDGDYGPQTEARLKKSPAGGFPIGATCNADPGTDPGTDPMDPPDDPNGMCMAYPASEMGCSADGLRLGTCAGGTEQSQPCANGCLRETGDDKCMGTTSNWSCSGTTGKTKLDDGNYYATNFGCWVDANGTNHSDSGDNCIPACLSTLQANGTCAGLGGPDCERHVNWYAADKDRFGCGAHLRITNPANGKSAVVAVIDAGPACWVEQDADNGIVDLSSRVTDYLFGSGEGWSDKAKIHVVEVDASVPLGPQ